MGSVQVVADSVGSVPRVFERESVVRRHDDLRGARIGNPCGAGNGRYDEGIQGKNRNGRTGHPRAKRGEVIVTGGVCEVGKIEGRYCNNKTSVKFF